MGEQVLRRKDRPAARLIEDHVAVDHREQSRLQRGADRAQIPGGHFHLTRRHRRHRGQRQRGQSRRAQGFHHEAVQLRGPIPDLGEAFPIITPLRLPPFALQMGGAPRRGEGGGGQALARASLFCGRVPERAGTMPENEAPSRGPGRCDFVCQFRQFVESRGEGFVLVRDQRSAQFEEDEFGHGLTLA